MIITSCMPEVQRKPEPVGESKMPRKQSKQKGRRISGVVTDDVALLIVSHLPSGLCTNDDWQRWGIQEAAHKYS